MSQDTNKPMDNNEQAVDIKGYRVLSGEEKLAINDLKDLEIGILSYINDHLKGLPEINQRSLALGITNIQQGFMWAIRAIARPNGE